MASTSTSSSGLLTTSSTGNVLRLTGLSSGLDVDGTVKKMMSGEQTKLDKANQARTKIEWKQEAYKDIISDVKDLQNSFFDPASSDTNILSSKNFAAFTATSSDNSVATVTPDVGAKLGTYSVNVIQLAEGAGFTAKLAGTGTSTISLSSKLTDISTATGNNATNQSIGSMSGTLNLNLKVNGGSDSTSTNGKDLKISITNSGELTVSGLISAINSQGSGYVKASYSELTQKITLTTVGTGSGKTLEVSSDSSQSLINLFSSSGTGEQKGKNAFLAIKAPGESDYTNITKSSNNFSIDGMNYNLVGVTPQASNDLSGTITPSDVVKTTVDASGKVTTTINAVSKITNTSSQTITVTQDTDKVYDKFKSFIDKYNKLVEKIHTKLTEKPNKDYAPLTDSQKESMTTDQITAWNTKAKVGILRNDNNLESMLRNLESAFSTQVTGVNYAITKYGSSTIGLDTSDGTDNVGQISITDPSKLKEIISTNSDELYKMFTNTSSITITSTSTQQQKEQYFKESGIFERISNIMEDNVGITGTTYNRSILTKYANYQDNFSNYGGAGLNTLPDQLYQQDVLIKKLKTEYSTIQTKYYNKFSALETAMTKLSSQQASLSSMLGN